MNNKRHTQTIIIIALLLLVILTELIWWLKPKSVSIPVNDTDILSRTLSTSLTNTTDTANDNNQITNSDNLARFTTGLEPLPENLSQYNAIFNVPFLYSIGYSVKFHPLYISQN